MKVVYLIGWAITRPPSYLLYGITEPVLRLNLWFKMKWLAA